MRNKKKTVWGQLPRVWVVFGFLCIAFSACNSHYTPVLDSAQGVHFKVTSLASGLNLAKAQKKPLFVFTHATWCPSCKEMENEVFNTKNIGDEMNQNFVNIAIDLDSADGKDLDNTYKIKATPTLLFFSAEGKLINKTEGAVAIDDLVRTANAVKN